MLATLIALVLAILLPATVAAQQPATSGQSQGCNAPVTAEQAQAVFDSFKTIAADDGCKFEGVSTEHSQMKASWSKPGAATESLVIVPRSCGPAASGGGERFSTRPAPGLEQACPATWRAVAETVRTHPYPSASLPAPSASAPSRDRELPVPPQSLAPPAMETRIGMALAILVVGAIAVVLMRRRRPAGGGNDA